MRIIPSSDDGVSNYYIKGNNSNLQVKENYVTKQFKQKVSWLQAVNWAKLSEQNENHVVKIDSLIRNNMECVGFTYPYEIGETARFFVKFNVSITQRKYVCDILISIYQNLLANQTIYINWNLDNIIIGDEIKLASPNSLRRVSKKQASDYPYTNDFLNVIISILYGFDFANEQIDNNQKDVLLMNIKSILTNKKVNLKDIGFLENHQIEENIADFKLVRKK